MTYSGEPIASLIEDVIYSQLGRFYTELLFNAEISHDSDEREHAKWLRNAIINKLENHSKSYH